MKLAGGLVFFLVIFLASASNAMAQSAEAAIALGNRHAVALRTNGEVLTWGENIYCQLGRGSRRAARLADEDERVVRFRRPGGNAALTR